MTRHIGLSRTCEIDKRYLLCLSNVAKAAKDLLHGYEPDDVVTPFRARDIEELERAVADLDRFCEEC